MQPTDMTTFVISFPHELRADSVQAFLGAVSGTYERNWLGMPVNTRLAFEVVATDRRLWHRLRVPSANADYVAVQLRTLVPGCRVEPARQQQGGTPTPRGPAWDYAVELGVTRLNRSLRMPAAEAFAATLLASLQLLKPGEAVLLQVIVMPIAPERPAASMPRAQRPRREGTVRPVMARPDRGAAQDLAARLSEPNLLSVVRIASRVRHGHDKTADRARARQLVTRVHHALASASGPYSRWRQRLVSQRRARRRVAEAAGLFLYPLHLSASDLAGLVGWPVGAPLVAGLPSGRSRQLPATEAIPRTGGKVVADSNFPGAERPLVLTLRDASRHLHVIGGTGVGKTTLLANLMAQDMAAGHGVVSLESKGDLFHSVIDLVPKQRIDDVIVLDFTDVERPVGFNILTDGSPRAAVERICALFERLYHDTRSVWTRELLFHGLSTLTTDARYTFVDLPALFVPMTDDEQAWRDTLVASLADKELKTFWRRYLDLHEAARERMAQPLLDRIWQLNARPEVRHVIGQSISSFDMADVVRSGKVLLVNLAGLPEATASLAGTLIFNSVWSAVQASAGRGQLARPSFLYLDEFQSFVNLPIAPEDLLAKARSFGLGLTLAHQHLGQLPPELRSAVMANAKSKVAFALSADDAMSFARDFGRMVTADDFMNLDAYEVICRIAADGSVSQPVTGLTRPPANPAGMARAVRDRSRAKYGRPVDGVERAIEQRRTAAAGGRKRPKLGPVEWK